MAEKTCAWWHVTTTDQELEAVLGTDGRYHLRLGERLVCAERYVRGRDEPAITGLTTHREDYHWWTDGTRFQEWAPRLPDGTYDHDKVQWWECYDWPVELTTTVCRPGDVPWVQRCSTAESRVWWPEHKDPSGPIGQLFRQLSNEFGRTCHACRYAPAMVVDHDHQTGFVRGLLCRRCNNGVDSCLHVSGCRWADYLNKPPAERLQLVYPTPGRARGRRAGGR
ncbi:hypothetical protein IU452_08080 [Nocardia transvalensis]|nr:hypothetical protein [Nocardia transvalensis]